MSKNKPLEFRARFGEIYNVYKTEEYFLKIDTIPDRLGFHD